MTDLRKRLCSVAALGALSALAAGCGGSGPESQRPVAARPTAEVREALRDPGSPVSVVRRFWNYLQVGALPAALEQYDPRVVRATGGGSFSGMLAGQQVTLAEVKVNPLAVESVADGVLVTAESLPRVGAKSQYSFYLRRREGRWRIVYDTLSASALQSFVQTTVQRGINPGAETPSGRAAKAGDDAVALFRAAALGLADTTAARRSTRSRRGPSRRSNDTADADRAPAGGDAEPEASPSP